MNWDGFRSEYIATGTSIIQESQEEGGRLFWVRLPNVIGKMV